MQRGAVVLGVVAERLRQRLAEGGFPEGHLAPVVAGGHVDDDLEQPAEVCHGTNLHGTDGAAVRQPGSSVSGRPASQPPVG